MTIKIVLFFSIVTSRDTIIIQIHSIVAFDLTLFSYEESYLRILKTQIRPSMMNSEFIYYNYMSAEEKKEIELAYKLFCIYDTTVHIG